MRNIRIAVVLGFLLSSAFCWAASNDLLNALHSQSSDRNKIRKVRASIAAGADVNACDRYDTPLIAATRETAILVNDLLRAGADPNKACGEFRVTPLMEAVKHTNYQAIMLLVGYGAAVNAKDNFGRTALDLLEGTNPIDRLTQKLLKSYGAKHGTIDGQSIDAMLAKHGDHRELQFREPPVFKVGQRVQWGSSIIEGSDFKGTRPYWLYEGDTETIQGTLVTVGELSCQVKVTEGFGVYKVGSIHQILKIDIQPLDSD